MCHKKFHRYSSMSMHRLVHSNIKPYSCPYCGMAFKTRPDLKQHLPVHTGGTRYTCKHCLREFVRNYIQYRKHLIDEHNDGSYLVCNLCPMKFVTRPLLNKHLQAHSGLRDYVCNQCPKRYSTAGSLKRHQFLLHSGTGRYGCGFCCQKFYYKSEVLRHLPSCPSFS